ncbi:hypothetical protein KPH14_010773 [Odynerus spinipes]|uniref:Polyprotein n=1 Tax=Odynerus spinipes TaxID=1348599 RepID=A0AAD9VMH1_9HYME|nr:hypothetical protein KPH14_010773 [Odynerus spinipes]
MADVKFLITKLNNSNYQIWKEKVQLLLMREKVWHTVEKVKPAAADEKWLGEDMHARSTIGLLVEDDQLRHIKKTTSAKEAWDSLKGYHEKASLSNIVYTLKRLCRSRLAENESMERHINGMLNMVDELEARGESIKERMVIALILGSLPDSYNTLVTALETRPEIDLTLELVKGKLLEEEQRRTNSRQNTKDVDDVALKVQHRTNQEATGTSGIKTNKGTTCFFCKRLGHQKKDCYKYKKWKYNKEKANQVTDKGASELCFIVGDQSTEKGTKWYLDSGATSHMTHNKDFFTKLEKISDSKVRIANGQYEEVKGIGEGNITCEENGKITAIKVKDVLFVPTLMDNLLSVKKLIAKGFDVKFQKEGCLIERNGQVIITAGSTGSLYYIQSDNKALLAKDGHNEYCIHMWHKRLGHRDPQAIKAMSSRNLADNIKIIDCNTIETCEVCLKGKMSRLPFPKRSDNRRRNILDLIHTDLCGPMQTMTPGKKRYFLTLIDDYSRYTHIYFLNSKSEVTDKIVEFIELMKTKFNRKPKCFRSDRGKEYINDRLIGVLKTEGIEMQHTAAYTPEQNGVAERKNRSLMEMGRCLLIEANLPNKYWAEAVNTANYLQNRIYSKSVNGIPITLWNGVKPDMSEVRTFGTRVYAHVPKELRKKLDDKAKELRFVGYSEETKGYRLLDTDNNKITVSRDVRFIEENDKNITIELKHDDTEEEANNSQSDSQEEKSTVEEETDTRAPMKRGPGRPRVVRTGSRGRPRKEHRMVPVDNTELEATSFAEASAGEVIPYTSADEWHNAIEDEVKSILKYDVCEIVDKPEGVNVIGSRMILTKKLNADGTLFRRKARLVAKGCSQRPGFDYDQTFAPVARLSSIRFAVALAIKFGMKIHQLDVATAYLNSSLDVPIYMELPVQFQDALVRIQKSKTVEASVRSKAKEMSTLLESKNKVCRLKKAIYGLKQAGRQWNITIDGSLKSLGLESSSADPCVYYKGNIKNLLLVIIYVDDTLVISRSLDEIMSVKASLSQRFELKDLGEAQCCLGIRFVRKRDEISLSQVGYVNELLNRYNMKDANPVRTPMEQGLELNDQIEPTQNLPFRELLGSLMYLAMATRPDIAYSVSHLSQYNNQFGKVHWNAAKRILRYLKGTINYGLTFTANKEPIIGYVDADWGGCTKDRRSYTGFTFKLSGAPISWESRKQRTVALSSTEAEYMGISEASKEAMYWKKFLRELNLGDKESITIYSDNLGAQKLTENNMYHRRTKHIDIRHHFVREAITQGVINIKYLGTEHMIADILTKALPTAKHVQCVKLLGLST